MVGYVLGKNGKGSHQIANGMAKIYMMHRERERERERESTKEGEVRFVCWSWEEYIWG